VGLHARCRWWWAFFVIVAYPLLLVEVVLLRFGYAISTANPRAPACWCAGARCSS
jgi:hypothetical protein